MYDSHDLIRLIKQASVDAVNASKPADLVFGKVISDNPLKIQIDQKIILTSMQLVLCRGVTDYTVNITDTETREITIHNALHIGDEVIMLRLSGGQKYVVVDRKG